MQHHDPGNGHRHTPGNKGHDAPSDPMDDALASGPHGSDGQSLTAVHGIMDGMDPEEITRAREVLARLLDLIDAGELDAAGDQLAAIRGALVALQSVGDTPPVQ